MKCPSCGKENPAGEQYCLDCGADLSAKPAAAGSTAAGQANAGASSLAMSDEEFQQLLHSPPAQPATCPHCGAPAPAGGAFCDNCGEPLTGAAAAGAPVSAAAATAQPAASPSADQAATPHDAAQAAAPHDASGAPDATTPPPTAQPAGTAPGTATVASITSVTLDIAGPASSSTYTMSGDEVKVGRRDPEAGIYPELDFDGNDIVVDNGERVHAVSRRHARIFRDGDVLKYEDLGSTNGSTLNGAPVLAHDPQPLKDGDKIVLGRTCRIAVHMP